MDNVLSGQTVTAELIRDFQVLAVIDKPSREKGYGPWSMVYDEAPESGGHGTGPSPVVSAFAALAACTAVTLAGVARRRRMALTRIRVEVSGGRAFAGKADAEEAAAEGRSVAQQRALKRILLEGSLSSAELDVLGRAARFCPVNRMMAGGLYQFEEEMICTAPETPELGTPLS
ncbi:MAG TPA: OsmC family protein [Candidatus Acidoferrales bacterium]|nr:OsmC family protein [Candidatus Acidoferrales bacterium]